MLEVNPRAAGFNYGVGWGPTAKPPIYHEAQQLALKLNAIAHEATQKAWDLEMAIRAVRLAETDIEKKQSVTELSILVAQSQTLNVPK